MTELQQRDEVVLQVYKLGDIYLSNKQTDLANGHNKLDDQSKEPEKISFFNRFGGMIMALCASFFFSISFLIVKVLANHGFEAFGCSVLFNAGVFIPCLVGILLHEKGPGASNRPRIFNEIWPLNVSHRKETVSILLVGTVVGS